MRTIRFGVIGCGLMGREFASATARWCHLSGLAARPEIVIACDKDAARLEWFKRNVPGLKMTADDYRRLLDDPSVDAVYCAVPHNLHERIYVDIIGSGKALMGEKPFGIDKPANDTILAAIARRGEVFARCSSEFPFFPAVQQIGRMIEASAFGRIIEVSSGFLHSSDLEPDKPINWKRMVQFNGRYGCMGDLGMHACHVPFRADWTPRNVRAVLSNIVPTRPDGKGGTAACETWDNATLLCETADASGNIFPWTIKTHRIAPGEKDTWYIEVLGTAASARFSTKNPKRLELLRYDGGEQVWQRIDMGHETAFESITGAIFEFGFSDAILQMWASFVQEMATGKLPSRFAGCVRPEETALSHRLFTAALESQEKAAAVAL